MSKIDSLAFLATDERVRKYLLPTDVPLIGGKVENPDKLLIKKPLQIGLSEPETTVLSNEDSSENAFVVLDFGVEMHGGVRLMTSYIKGAKYPKVKITFGESLTEALSTVGKKDATNDHAIRQFSIPVANLSDQTWGETGFRFVKIELVTKNCSVKFKSILGAFLFRDLEYKGSFVCNDKQINDIYDTCLYTCHLCLQNMLWDGIKRDRLVWIGDMMVESKLTHQVFGGLPIIPESLEFVRNQTPVANWMNNLPSYSMWWIMIVKDWYFATGDSEFLLRQKDYCLALLDRLCKYINDDGSDNFTDYFLDWPTRNNTQKSKSGVRGLLRLTLSDGVYLADIFGNKELKHRLVDRKSRLDKVTDDCYGTKQVAAMLSLCENMESSAAADIILQEGTKDFSSFMVYFLLSALAKDGKGEDAVSLMKEYYGMMLRKGATTFFEDYHLEWDENSGNIAELPKKGQNDIHGDFGDHCYKKFRHSLCHGWAAGAAPFLTEYVLGVKIIEPGCKVLEIDPNLCGLEYVKGTYPTPFGTVEIEHTLNGKGKVVTKVKAPKSVKIKYKK